ncbi:hypothetical protein [Haliscomenobacter sp.]|uniref:hypothetical protein n=1 Tax=Haliscomenobacter sp. TaxID=2717303 RepID=UPI003BAB2B8D
MADTTFSIDTINLNYLTDEKGKQTAVLIPIEDWEEIKKMIEYILLKNSLLQAFQEMKEMKKGLKSRLSLNDVINEL